MSPLFGEFCLCQDCLSVKTFTDERHNGQELCICGGDFCGCFDCSIQADLIIQSVPYIQASRPLLFFSADEIPF